MSHDVSYFTNDANEAVNIIFVSCPEDMEHSKNVYKPKMTHQIFDKESIFGYCELQINLYYSSATYHCYVEISHDDVWPNGMLSLNADDIIGSLKPWLREAMVLNKLDFLKILSSSDRRICFGDVLHDFHHELLNSKRSFLYASIHCCDLNDTNFVKLHQRFESLIIMYIDAANFIDVTDCNWRVIYLYEKRTVQPGITFYYPIGFCTIYIFNFAKLGRISQFFIIPKYQRKGLGFTLLTKVYEYLRSNRFSLRKITVESPNEIFTDLRDKVDVMHCIGLPYFKKNIIRKGFTQEMSTQAMIHFKISRKQAKKIYEILRAYYSEPGTHEYKKFKSDFIKDRKLEIVGLKYLNPNEKDEYLKIFEEDIILEANNMDHTFDKFMKGIENVLRYLKKEKPLASA